MAKNTGAFHIARQIFDSEIWTDKPSTWNKIWIYILGKVKYTDTDKFKKGECFFNFSRERKDIGIDITEDMIKKCLTYLRKRGMIRTLRSTRGTVVKVMNYNYFQTLENYVQEGARQNDTKKQKSEISRTTSSTKEPVGNGKNNNDLQGDKNNSSTTQSTSQARAKHDVSTPIHKEVKKGSSVKKNYSETILQIVKDFYILKSKNHKNAIKVTDSLLENSYYAIDKLNRIDGIALDYITTAITRSVMDDFWRDQIMSLSGLRKKRDGVMKFINLANQVMKSDYVPEKTKKVIGYMYMCPACNEEVSKREYREVKAWDAYTCEVEGCTKTQLINKEMIGSTLIYLKEIYKDIS